MRGGFRVPRVELGVFHTIRLHSVRPTDMPDVEGAIRTSKMTGRPCRWSSLRFPAPFLDVQRAASTGTALTRKEGNPYMWTGLLQALP